MFQPIKTAPQTETILLLCRSYSGLIIVEGYWQKNKHINQFNSQLGCWKPYCGVSNMTSTANLDAIGWMPIIDKAVMDGSELYSIEEWEKRINKT